MVKKGRSPTMRHVSRTHRVSLDWLFERLDRKKYEGTRLRWVDTLNQIADIMSKGSFTAQQWLHLCMLCQLGPVGTAISDPLVAPIKKPKAPKKAKPLVPPLLKNRQTNRVNDRYSGKSFTNKSAATKARIAYFCFTFAVRSFALSGAGFHMSGSGQGLSLIHISEPTRPY